VVRVVVIIGGGFRWWERLKTAPWCGVSTYLLTYGVHCAAHVSNPPISVRKYINTYPRTYGYGA
jgi:hypothetical protein